MKKSKTSKAGLVKFLPTTWDKVILVTTWVEHCLDHLKCT